MQKKHQYSLAIIVFVTVSAVIYFAALRNSATIRQLLSFNAGDCLLPCVLGIEIGKTPVEVAEGILMSAVPEEQQVSRTEIWILGEDQTTKIYINLVPEDPRLGDYIRQISITAEDRGYITTLGQALEAGYVPSKVYRNAVNPPNSVNLLLVTNAGTPIAFWVSGFNQVDVQSPIVQIIVTKEVSQMNAHRVTTHFMTEIAWQGSADVEDYINALPLPRN
jgi:hypothetical protein